MHIKTATYITHTLESAPYTQMCLFYGYEFGFFVKSHSYPQLLYFVC